MSENRRSRTRMQRFEAFTFVAVGALLAGCNRHDAAGSLSSRSVAEGQSTSPQPLVPALPPSGVAVAGHNGGNLGHAVALGGNGVVVAAGAGGSSGSVHVSTRTAAAGEGEAKEESAAAILGKLHQSNLKEVDMGKIAEIHGNSREVKNYGTTLVKDHTAADKRIVAFAKAEHIDLTGAGDKMDTMKPETGAGFDAQFAKEMLQDHRRDIAEATAARDSAKDAKLRSLLSSLLPVLKKHEELAQKIVDRAGEQK